MLATERVHRGGCLVHIVRPVTIKMMQYRKPTLGGYEAPGTGLNCGSIPDDVLHSR